MERIEFIIPAYDRVYHLGCMLFALQAQSRKNWLANVVVDNTPTENITWIENIFNADPRIRFTFLNKRFNDWGHTPRNVGLENASGEWVVMTGEDNYYVPSFVYNVSQAITSGVNFIYCDMVHNWSSDQYLPVKTSPKTGNIDIGCCVYRTELAKKMRLDPSDVCADGRFAEQFVRNFGGVSKITKTLYVHN